MLIPFMISKIHRARVTQVDLHYQGSVSIDEELMEKANLRLFQKVEVYNISNGNRFETYVLAAERGSRRVVVNGAAAHLTAPGDIVIIAAYALIDEKDLNSLNSVVLIVNDANEVERVIQGKL